MTEYSILVSQIRKDKERLIQRLSRNISAQGDCKVWTGCSNNDGYPKISFRVNGRHVQVYVHRLFFVLKSAEPISLNMEIDHTCHNRKCVNPAHMQLVSGSMNKRRRKRK